MISESVIALLNKKVKQYNTPDFIQNDPISIPHLFTKKQDIEIAGFFAAILAWGQRGTIIVKSKELMKRMDDSPYDFILNCKDTDLKNLLTFKHRTFNATDLLYFIDFFKAHYLKFESLEDAFVIVNDPLQNVKQNLIAFKKYTESGEYYPKRSGKHIATPAKNSACKRINMFLRWMVRQDNTRVDFGIWKKIKPSQLICPCDLHVERSIFHLGLMQPAKVNWNYAENLSEILKTLDAKDPAKYDFALFGMSVEKYFA
jgi:uncharacterized protein (TIGR02757 family)